MSVTLRKLSVNDGRDIYDMLQEIPASENGYGNSINGATYEAYRDWLVKRDWESRQNGVFDGWKVPSTKYWLYVDEKPVGAGNIRHFLTDALRQAGGHIGYAVRPSERGKGYGKALLGQLLAQCRCMGLEKALITIQAQNAASIAVAKANGGVVCKQNAERVYVWVSLSE